tara:strand:+ start:97 stop:1335 length:1239 start_codon:yes stop_codon:yes gene_type:complete
MNLPAALNRLVRYGAIGLIAAAIHAAVLLGLGSWLPLSIANPIGFLAASIAGYLGHALVTFREETGGRRFARRWLLLQYVVNISVCSLLPLLSAPTVVLVFTPTALNALIWNRAARHSDRCQSQGRIPPAVHADDFGLHDSINQAILALTRANKLQSASLLVNAPKSIEAVNAWKSNQQRPTLYLHLCLTEGTAVPGRPDAPYSFGELLLASVWPPLRRRLQPQVHRSIQQQLSLFRELTGHQYIQVDGHQHVHLIPMVLDDLLDQADEQGINWIRTTREAIPSGLRVSDWARACRNGGWVKWFILQLLSKQAKRRLKEQGISTNQSFAGVLFTGQMVGMPLQLAWEQLHSQGTRPRTESPLILIHPAKYPIEENEMQDKGFGESQQFFSSIMRQKELQAAKSLKRARTSEP